MKQKLQRNIAMTFRVDAEEQALIKQKMEFAGMKNLRIFLLKMALTGRVIQFNLSGVSECSRLLGNIAGNVNQLAKRANAMGSVHGNDLADIKNGIDECRAELNRTNKILAGILEAEQRSQLKLKASE